MVGGLPKIDLSGASRETMAGPPQREVIVAAALEIIRAQYLGKGSQEKAPTAELMDMVAHIEAALKGSAPASGGGGYGGGAGRGREQG